MSKKNRYLASEISKNNAVKKRQMKNLIDSF